MAYLKIPLGNGTAIVETEDQPGAKPVSILGDRSAQVVAAVESSLAALQELAVCITKNLIADPPDGPDEIELTFGIKASAEMNALVIAKAQGEANYSVKLKWTRTRSTA